MLYARQIIATSVILFSLVILPVRAHAIELTGAWATDANLCGLVFTKKGSESYLRSLMAG